MPFNKPHRWRISSALIAGISLVMIAIGVTFGWFVFSVSQGILIHKGIQQTTATARSVAASLRQESRAPRSTPITQDLNDLPAGQLYLLLTTGNGKFIASNRPLPPLPPKTQWMHPGSSGWFRFHDIPYVFTIRPLALGGGVRRLVVVDGLVRTASLLTVLRWALITGEALLILSSIVAIMLVVRLLTDSLQSLERWAGTITLNTCDSRPVTRSSRITEVVSLAATLNAMLDRLRSSQERERQFIANAAHSLRNPIHAIRGYSRMLSRQYAHAEARREALTALARESQAMATLVDRLLQISRLDQDESLPSLVPFAIVACVRSLFPALCDACLHHELMLQHETPESVLVVSDPELLEIILRILVENADAYADPGTPVVIFIRPGPTADRVRIGVLNQGPEIPPANIDRLFDRFYRSRQEHSSGHFGLGLAIADSLVQRIRGQWAVESHHHQTIFAIDLPSEMTGSQPASTTER